MGRVRLDANSVEVFDRATRAMADFKRLFGRSLEPSFVAELYAAKELGFEVNLGSTEPGHDAVGVDGRKYQIKYRSETTQNVDVNNFDFDFLVLVNLDEGYQLVGLWKISREQAEKLFVWRENFRKYQCIQVKLKRVAERIC